MSNQITHYGNKISVFAQRTNIALHEVNAQYTHCEVDFENKPEWLFKANPATAQIPAITYGGPVVPFDQPSPESAKITESIVILEFLADLFPSSDLLPADPVERAQVRFFISTLDTKFWPVMLAWMRGAPPNDMVDGAKALQALLSQEGKGPYAVGDKFTIADAAFAPMWARFRLITERDIGVEAFGKEQHISSAIRLLGVPELAKFRAYANRLLERPSVKATWYPEDCNEYLTRKAARFIKK
ncbi:glutathione S-transferase C-terminal-like protein [Coniophora puteana RWD-64-598 SS2]|uniref:Glutathione S-transferase C-terminal-like protein n=1 Tax=Coniophora puteana (strain RWD-64-598) TaxID=741705 RepID=A0A5M3M9D3_CONPW|nr:glutathione S-transferase C-terminal-like protein [Coniophora puteana RWD-64-598 SS2]EIW75410.1 glutathione S-transferase C-terminal-like protein [Coniophora puteana RWD-64-598 SS2]